MRFLLRIPASLATPAESPRRTKHRMPMGEGHLQHGPPSLLYEPLEEYRFPQHKWTSFSSFFPDSHETYTHIDKETHTQPHTYRHTHTHTFFFAEKVLWVRQRTIKLRENKGPSLTKHQTANNRIWIMQQEFNYNKCLKNKGRDRHWDLSCAKLTGCDFRLFSHDEMSPA